MNYNTASYIWFGMILNHSHKGALAFWLLTIFLVGISMPVQGSPPPTPIILQFKNPTYEAGTFSTTEGGNVQAPNFKIQAKNIFYTKRKEGSSSQHLITAQDSLCFTYEDQFFVGDYLQVDLEKKSFLLLGGRGEKNRWIFGGSLLRWEPNHPLLIEELFITNSLSKEPSWRIVAKEATFDSGDSVYAKNIQGEFFGLPFFWLPQWRCHLQEGFSNLYYKVQWDTGLGPRSSLRWRVYKNAVLELFLRGDYLLNKGPGGAFETIYRDEKNKTSCYTKSYIANNKSFPYEKGNFHYRLLGSYDRTNQEGASGIHVSYDKFSDRKMVSNFPSAENFESQAARATLLAVHHKSESLSVLAHLRPRINSFQTINQELPQAWVTLSPWKKDRLITLFNRFRAGFLDYIYTNQTHQSFEAAGVDPKRSAARIESIQQLYWHKKLYSLEWKQRGEMHTIFYSQGPTNHAQIQWVALYKTDLHSPWMAHYQHVHHEITPYCSLFGKSTPTTSINNHYYFDVSDGQALIGQIRWGCKQRWQGKKSGWNIFLDLYGFSFFAGQYQPLNQTTPRLYADLHCQTRYGRLAGQLIWNKAAQLVDRCTIKWEQTLSEDLAWSLEFRTRSQYDWRKAVDFAFDFEASRSCKSLESSAMSDQRSTLLAHVFARFHPRCTLEIQSEYGWHRSDQKPYYMLHGELSGIISECWKAVGIIEKTPGDYRFSYKMARLL